jgi:hypothetical protein
MSSSELDPDSYLRQGLVQALRKEHFGKLCSAEERDSSHMANLLSQTITWSMVASLVLWLDAGVGFDIWQSGGIVALFLFALAAYAGATKRFRTAALIIFLAWAASAVFSALQDGLSSAALTHLLPFAIVIVSIWMWGAIRLAVSIPFLLPLALIVVFVPLLTQDLWIVGDEIDGQLVAVAIVALGPLSLFIAFRYARTDLRLLLVEAIERLGADQPQEGERAAEAVINAPRKEGVEAPTKGWLAERIGPSYLRADPEAIASKIEAAIKPSFRRQTTLRLGRLVIGILAFFAAFTYLLAWAVVPTSTSARWIGHPVSTTHVTFAYWTVTLPTGAYIAVALLLAIVASAAFIAFALTEDRYSDAVAAVLVREPAGDCVMLAVPYLEIFSESETTGHKARSAALEASN